MLEERNYQRAGKLLGEVWSEAIIDTHPVVAEYIVPGSGQDSAITAYPSELWIRNHIHTSQYLLQIVKSDDRTCCNKNRSNLDYITKTLPGLIKTVNTKFGIQLADHNTDGGQWKSLPWTLALAKLIQDQSPVSDPVPFDLLCPSTKGTLSVHLCKICRIYFAT